MRATTRVKTPRQLRRHLERIRIETLDLHAAAQAYIYDFQTRTPAQVLLLNQLRLLHEVAEVASGGMLWVEDPQPPKGDS